MKLNKLMAVVIAIFAVNFAINAQYGSLTADLDKLIKKYEPIVLAKFKKQDPGMYNALLKDKAVLRILTIDEIEDANIAEEQAILKNTVHKIANPFAFKA